MNVKRRKYLLEFLSLIILCCFIACEREDISNKNSGSSEILVSKNLPFSAILNIKHDDNIGVDIDVYLISTQENVWSKDNLVIELGEKKVVITNLKNLEPYHYEVTHNGELLFEADFTIPKSSEWITNLSSISTSGEIDLEGKHILFNKMSMPSGIFIVNENGKTIWARESPNFVKMVKLTSRNTILTLEDNTGNQFGSANIILETTFAGDTLTHLEYGQADFIKIAHHDVLPLNQGNFAFITDQPIENNYVVDGISVLNPNGTQVWEWNSSPFITIPSSNNEEFVQPWGNSLTIDSFDNNYIISFRNLNQVWKVNSSTGEVIWKLGEEGTIPLSNQDGFMFQHHAQMIDENELILFDNGDMDNRAYSRIVTYTIDFEQENAILSTEIILPDELFSPFMGAVQVLPDGFLVTSSIPGIIAQLDDNGDVVGQFNFEDRIFRASIIEDFLD